MILPASANREIDARANIRASGFWSDQRNAIIDVRIFYPHAPSYLAGSLSGLCKSFEAEKRDTAVIVSCRWIKDPSLLSFFQVVAVLDKRASRQLEN
jgi:hypothetical protein